MTAWIPSLSVFTRPPSPHAVGRARELATLHEQLAALLLGQGGLVLIGGEEGIGKTTLATAICREARQMSALVLAGHCYDLATRPPYSLWHDLAERYRPGETLPAPPAPLAGHDAAPPSCREAFFAT